MPYIGVLYEIPNTRIQIGPTICGLAPIFFLVPTALLSPGAVIRIGVGENLYLKANTKVLFGFTFIASTMSFNLEYVM